MLKKIYYIVIIICAISNLYAQKDNSYYRQFNINLNYAKRIYNIDNCYNTSFQVFSLLDDSTLVNINNIRFNIYDEDKLYIIYGDINSLAGNNIKIFAFDTINYKAKSTYKLDSSKIRLFSAIARDNYSIIWNYARKKIDYNLYFVNENDTVFAFLIPIWQKNGQIIYGKYHNKKYFLINNDFKEVYSYISSESYKAFNIDEDEIYLKYDNDIIPSIPSIFYTLAYKDIFDYVIIETKNKYVYLNNFELGSYTHIEK